MENINTLFSKKNNNSVEILAKNEDNFQIELVKELDVEDEKKINIFLNDNRDRISPNSLLITKSVKKYFSFPKTLSFLARLNNEPIAFIIGIEIEKLDDKNLFQKEVNWGKGNTIYIFSHEIKLKYSQRKYENILNKIALNWLSKKGYEYICSYEKKGKAEQIFPGCVIIKRVENWKNSGKIYEYFKLSL
ncbi:MAG: hypothetical protein U9R41_01130 [Candidatus Marinimicrobia bacterium]|nr:hypothetical protein [Candidatus Neomarinimicrobiota bacterium]